MFLVLYTRSTKIVNSLFTRCLKKTVCQPALTPPESRRAECLHPVVQKVRFRLLQSTAINTQFPPFQKRKRTYPSNCNQAVSYTPFASLSLNSPTGCAHPEYSDGFVRSKHKKDRKNLKSSEKEGIGIFDQQQLHIRPQSLERRQSVKLGYIYTTQGTGAMESRGVKRRSEMHHSPRKKQPRHVGSEHAAYSSGVSLEIDPWTQYMWQFYESRHQTKEVYMKKMRLREALYTLMKGVFPHCGVYVVGSSMNGFGSNNSDLDMCLMLSPSEINQKKEAPELLRILLKSLRTCSFLREINLIRAKVPILKFHDQIGGLEVDLSINNPVGIRNTHLLYSYSRMDKRVNPLVLFVKHWAKCQQINDASQGTISSFSLVLMVIHFLQTSHRGEPAVLPSLQQMYPQKFNNHIDIRLLTLSDKLPEYTSPNTQPLGDLFKCFLRYYAHEFNFQEDAISVRLGKKLSISQVIGTNPSQWKFLCIEEPFDLSNTARSVYDLYVFQRIYRVIRLSYARLTQTDNINSILYQPL